MLSERGNGFKIAMNALNVGRIKLAAACLMHNEE
jgi:alkylation response protein AidB-like acyl-CoA dehydrogenase